MRKNRKRKIKEVGFELPVKRPALLGLLSLMSGLRTNKITFVDLNKKE